MLTLDNKGVNTLNNKEVNILNNKEVNTLNNKEVNILNNKEVNILNNKEVNILDNNQPLDNHSTHLKDTTLFISKYSLLLSLQSYHLLIYSLPFSKSHSTPLSLPLHYGPAILFKYIQHTNQLIILSSQSIVTLY